MSERYGLAGKDFLGDFIEKARRDGLSEALSDCRKEFPGFLNRFNNGLIDSYLAFAVDDCDRVLEVGCGYGALSMKLSDICDRVTAVDVNEKCAELTELRAEDEGRENVEVVAGNAAEMDFDDNFDAAYMVGVLEWIPVSTNSEDPRESQREFLEHVNDQLDEGGKVVIGIENRFGAQYFLGWKDHNGLWGTNLLPRKLANAYSKLRGKGGYEVYTHSRKGYEELLEESGFENVKFYAPLRSYRFPRFMVPLEKLRYFFSNVFVPENRKQGVGAKMFSLLPSWFLGFFAPHYVIVGERQ